MASAYVVEILCCDGSSLHATSCQAASIQLIRANGQPIGPTQMVHANWFSVSRQYKGTGCLSKRYYKTEICYTGTYDVNTAAVSNIILKCTFVSFPLHDFIMIRSLHGIGKCKSTDFWLRTAEDSVQQICNRIKLA